VRFGVFLREQITAHVSCKVSRYATALEREIKSVESTMLIPVDAFSHLPMLAGKVLDPERSTFRISRKTFDDWDRRAQEAGYGDNWRRTHEEREATRSKALKGRLGQDLWVFAYGSLMWDPAIHVVEIRSAALTGFHRRFCLKVEIGRGSQEKPALMAALDVGSECQGLALRIPAHSVDRETEILWMREMIGEGYIPVFRNVATPQGPVDALAFVMDRQSARFADIGAEEAADMIATGSGLLGTNREYFDNLATHVEALGIRDKVFEGIRASLYRSMRAR
jgi:glutathione-specific gamma-glutamylcyclotransferase